MPIIKPDLGPCSCNFAAGAGLYIQGDGSQSSPVEISVENATIVYEYTGGILDYTQFPSMSTVLINLSEIPGTSTARYIFPSGDGYDLNLFFKNNTTAGGYLRPDPTFLLSLAAGGLTNVRLSPHRGEPCAFVYSS